VEPLPREAGTGEVEAEDEEEEEEEEDEEDEEEENGDRMPPHKASGDIQ
jgi:hypothetical protein